jgi:hypothetical protein
MKPSYGQRIWVNRLGIYGRCLSISGKWAVVEDDNGQRHAVPVDDIEAIENGDPDQQPDIPDR